MPFLRRPDSDAILRPAVDKLPRDIWDYLAFAPRTEPGPSRRRECREWDLT